MRDRPIYTPDSDINTEYHYSKCGINFAHFFFVVVVHFNVMQDEDMLTLSDSQNLPKAKRRRSHISLSGSAIIEIASSSDNLINPNSSSRDVTFSPSNENGTTSLEMSNGGALVANPTLEVEIAKVPDTFFAALFLTFSRPLLAFLNGDPENQSTIRNSTEEVSSLVPDSSASQIDDNGTAATMDTFSQQDHGAKLQQRAVAIKIMSVVGLLYCIYSYYVRIWWLLFSFGWLFNPIGFYAAHYLKKKVMLTVSF